MLGFIPYLCLCLLNTADAKKIVAVNSCTKLHKVDMVRGDDDAAVELQKGRRTFLQQKTGLVASHDGSYLLSTLN